MTIQEAIEARHSVRAYKNQSLSEEIVKVLEDEIVKLNNEGQPLSPRKANDVRLLWNKTLTFNKLAFLFC